MTDHVLGHKNGLENLSVMNQKRVPDKIRRHHRAPRPGLDRFFRACVVHLVDLLQKMRLDEGSFFQRSRHKNQMLTFLFRTATLENETIARLVFAACFKSFRQLSPWTDRMMTSAATLGFALPAAHWMINWVHCHTADMRSSTFPARASGLATRNVHVINIANLPDRRVGVLVNAADFAGRHLHQRVTALEIVQRRLLTGAACNLPAATRRQLNVVNVCTERN